VGLGFRRLGVIDLATSHQPMPNEDGSLRLVANGEIYNFQELRDRLTPRHTLRTRATSRPSCTPTRSTGPTASISFADVRLRHLGPWPARMTLAVDRFGKKPLYYALDGKKLVFGSELKCLREHPGIGLDLRLRGPGRVPEHRLHPRPRSIYRAIRKLPPGHTLTVAANGGSRLAEYWHPRLCAPPEQSRASIEELAAELRERLLEAVRLRMISDVPLGRSSAAGSTAASLSV
jgi:asparagine synthase (glutamine-hydrolysing)